MGFLGNSSSKVRLRCGLFITCSIRAVNVCIVVGGRSERKIRKEFNELLLLSRTLEENGVRANDNSLLGGVFTTAVCRRTR